MFSTSKTTAFVVLVVSSVLLVSCSDLDLLPPTSTIDAPAEAAEEWYVATSTMEALEADALVCQSKREEFRREMEAGSTFLFFGQLLLGGTVDIELDASKVGFSTIEEGEGRAIVEARGEVRAAVGGSVSSDILNERWLMVQENGEWKWCGDATTSVQINALLSESGETTNSINQDTTALYPVRINGMVGYLNRKAETVIEPQFVGGRLFSEGLASIVTDKDTRLWGFINTNGDVVIEPRFEEVMPFSEGLAAVRMDDTWGYIDTSGNLVIEPRFFPEATAIESLSFSEGVAVVGVQPDSFGHAAQEVGFINRNGDFLIEPKFDLAKSFSGGLAPVLASGPRQSGFINTNGEFVIELPDSLRALGYFYDDLAPAADSVLQFEGKPAYGFINREGEWAIGPISGVSSLRPFKDGYAAFARQDEGRGYHTWGYINTEGEVVVEPQFSMAYDFYHGLALVITQEGESGFIDPDGNWVFKND